MGKFNLNGLNAPPKSIINGYSTGGLVNGNGTNYNGESNCEYKKTLSGALTANVYKEILSVSGSGVIDLCLVYANGDTTSRTLGLKVIIDGITVFDAVSGANTQSGGGYFAIGYGTQSNLSIQINPMTFNLSLSVSIKSSLSETDKIALGYIYRTT